MKPALKPELRNKCRAFRNRRSKAGETLTETLIAMLIVGLSSVLFLTMIGASGRIFRMAEKKYEEIYEVIAEADVQGTPLTGDAVSGLGEITIQGTSNATLGVDWYGDKEYVLSYKAK